LALNLRRTSAIDARMPRTTATALESAATTALVSRAFRRSALVRNS
jgi:hypothetical protein